MLDTLVHKHLRLPYTLHIEELNTPKKPRMTVILLHGIGSSTNMWRDVTTSLPVDVRVVAIDLLGFGKSPQPTWATYSVSTQVKSVVKTMVLNRLPPGSLLVGHSLGALVATEVAGAVPVYVSELLLISPPVYRPSRGKVVATQREDILRGIYKIMHRNPKTSEKALLLARKYYAKRNGINLARDLNIDTFLATLKAWIVNQAAIDPIKQIKIPTTILSGSLDPLVIGKNLDRLSKTNKFISHTVVKGAGHNVVGTMRSAVVERLQEMTYPSDANT